MKRLNVPVNRIAKEIGFSPATVSRVIHHPEVVNTNSKKEIETALTKAGYNLSQLQKDSIETNKRIIIAVIPSVDNPFYRPVLKGIKASASSHNFEVILYQGTITPTNKEIFMDVVRASNVRGVICLCRKLDKETADSISQEIPFIQCCEYNKEAQAPYVSINDFASAKNAVNYLINRGYSKIAIINGPMSFNYAQERLRGFESALAEKHITVPKLWQISLPEVGYGVGYSAACQILGSENKPEAIFCAADVFAVSTIKAANRFGLRIPEDLGIVGFDNIDITTVTVPSLTTVSQPGYQIGFTGAETLFELIYSPSDKPRSILLDTELIARDSTIQKI